MRRIIISYITAVFTSYYQRNIKMDSSDFQILFILFLVIISPLYILPISVVVLLGHARVANLDEGLCFPNLGMVDTNIGSVSSSAKILNVPYDIDSVLTSIPSKRAQILLNLNISKVDSDGYCYFVPENQKKVQHLLELEQDDLPTLTMKYPPPPGSINLKTQGAVRSWVSSTTSPTNGISCFIDETTKEAWTEPVGQIGAGFGVAWSILVVIVIVAIFVCHILDK